jgi:hypothetical protein
MKIKVNAPPPKSVTRIFEAISERNIKAETVKFLSFYGC